MYGGKGQNMAEESRDAEMPFENSDYRIRKIPPLVKRERSPSSADINSNWFLGNLTFNHPSLPENPRDY